jgi:hypothetical protein
MNEFPVVVIDFKKALIHSCEMLGLILSRFGSLSGSQAVGDVE